MRSTHRLAIVLVVVLALLVAAVPLLSSCSKPAPTPTATPRPTATPTTAAPSATATPVPTATPTKAPATPTPTSAPTATPTAAATKPAAYKIGAIRGLTGVAGWSGEQLRDGAQMAVDEINAAGGVGGVPLSIITEECGWQPQPAVQGVTKLTEVDKVPVIVAGGSSVIPAIKPITEEKKVAMFVDAAILEESVFQGTKYMVSHVMTREVQSKIMSDIPTQMGFKTAVIAYSNNALGQGWNKLVTQYFTASGGKILASESHELDQKDFRTTLLKFKSLNPDVVFLMVYSWSLGALMVQQSAEIGFQPKLFLGSQNMVYDDFIRQAGAAAEGVVVVPVGWNPYDSSNPKANAFKQKWDAKFPNNPMTFYAGYGYDAIYNVATAIQQGGYTGEGIAKALRTLKDYTGVSGKYSFDPDTGKPILAPGPVVRVQGGKFAAWSPGK